MLAYVIYANDTKRRDTTHRPVEPIKKQREISGGIAHRTSKKGTQER